MKKISNADSKLIFTYKQFLKIMKIGKQNEARFSADFHWKPFSEKEYISKAQNIFL